MICSSLDGEARTDGSKVSHCLVLSGRDGHVSGCGPSVVLFVKANIVCKQERERIDMAAMGSKVRAVHPPIVLGREVRSMGGQAFKHVCVIANACGDYSAALENLGRLQIGALADGVLELREVSCACRIP